MNLEIVRLAAVAPQPWRNGGGQTRELLAWPPGSGVDWRVRVSVADIDRDGPFSPFPGVQRCFTVLEGRGVVLDFTGELQRLTPASAPLAFEGAEAPGCQLIDGPTRDLNLMGRHAAGTVQMRAALEGDTVPSPARWFGLYCASPALLFSPTAGPQALPSDSLAWSDAPPDAAWRLAAAPGAALRAWWLQLEPHA